MEECVVTPERRPKSPRTGGRKTAHGLGYFGMALTDNTRGALFMALAMASFTANDALSFGFFGRHIERQRQRISGGHGVGTGTR